jgi:DNA-binding SARP family transcriptional activator
MLLGRFEALVDERPVPAAAWPQRRAAELVKVLALAPGHRLPRDEVLETLWPQLGADAAAANLHKAASYARRALGARDAVVVRGGMVELAPDSVVTTDVERFERGDDAAYGGDLLPDDPYASWALAARARLRRRRLELLRRRGEWDAILQEDAADEEAHSALARRHLERGDRVAAARQLRRLGDELARLGVEPSAEARARARGCAR